MSYPQPGWPPPHAGVRPWVPYGAPPAHPYPPYAHPARPAETPKDEYWATELNANPLGLENMHIKADSMPREGNNASSSTSNARIPSSTSYSRASDYAHRRSYPPNASTKASLAPSKSHPNSRVPSPARPRHQERDRDVVAPGARYASYTDVQVPDTMSNGRSSITAYQRPPSRSHGGRASVPAESGDRYSSASASAAAHATQMAARSQTLPGASYHRYSNAAVPGSGTPQAQGIQRSKTLPGEVLATSPRRERTRTAPIPRTSDWYDYRYPQDNYDESVEEGEGEQDGRNLSSRTYVNTDDGMKERKGIDRVHDWISETQYASSSQHDREPDARAKEKLRSKSYHAPFEANYDGYGDERAYDVPAASAARYDRERGRERDGIERRASAPNPTYASVRPFDQDQDRNTSYVGLGTRVMEEPEDMHGHYVSHEPSRTHSRYARARISPHREREQDWTYRDDNYPSGSSSSSGSDDESEDAYDKPPLGRHDSTRQRECKTVGTPHPAALRRFSDRSDTLRVDDGVDVGATTQVKAHLPSPRSLRQSSRTPSARPSYEQVHAERERDYERAETSNGLLTTGMSSASAAAAVGGYGYGTPPITPTRQDQAHRTDSSRVTYAPQPTSSASTAAMTSAAESAHTPARLAYLYRGNSASPSPGSHRAVSTQPTSQSHMHVSQLSQSQAYIQARPGQYAAGYAETKPKKRSPHASRSPSPLPPGQGTSSSSAYYAAIGQSSTATPTPTRAHSRTHGHSNRHGHDQIHPHASAQVAAQTTTSGRRYSSSRAAIAGSGYSSASGAAAAVSSSASGAAATQAVGSDARHVRAGLWNRRGDHLTETGYVVYCPPGRCYPRELADYPDTAFKDHLGNIVYKRPDACPELPESISRSAGRAPERGYDSFVKYVLVNSTY